MGTDLLSEGPGLNLGPKGAKCGPTLETHRLLLDRHRHHLGAALHLRPEDTAALTGLGGAFRCLAGILAGREDLEANDLALSNRPEVSDADLNLDAA
jgi:hypothetical protein